MVSSGDIVSVDRAGCADIWGIGDWRDKVFGLVATNEFVVIDVHTGHATYISAGRENCAGVHPRAHRAVTATLPR